MRSFWSHLFGGALLSIAAVTLASAANLPPLSGANVDTPIGVGNQIINSVNSLITPQSMADVGQPRNLLKNPKFDIYPLGATNIYTSGGWVQNLTSITSPAYHAAAWAAYAGTATVNTVQLANVTTSLPPGFANAEQIGRPSGATSTTQICLVQPIRSEKVVGVQSQPVTPSFYAKAGSGFSAASSNLQIYLLTGTGTNEGLSTLVSAAPTTINSFAGAANPINGTTQNITTSWARYSIPSAGYLPSTATEAALEICYTPVGTAAANDNVQLTGVQLEVGSVASAFEVRPLPSEQATVYADDAWTLADGAATRRYSVGLATSSVTAQYALAFPVTMSAVPTTVIATAGSFAATTGAGAAANCTTLAGIATSNTVNSAGLSCTTSGLTQGQASELLGQAIGNAFILFWNEL